MAKNRKKTQEPTESFVKSCTDFEIFIESKISMDNMANL